MNTTYTFDDFMQAIDAQCSILLGCSPHDLADYPYHDDWENCQEDLAFVAPEDVARQEQVFKNHVDYTIQDLTAECDMDMNPHSMPY